MNYRELEKNLGGRSSNCSGGSMSFAAVVLRRSQAAATVKNRRAGQT
jgi:hypothetical protein